MCTRRWTAESHLVVALIDGLRVVAFPYNDAASPIVCQCVGPGSLRLGRGGILVHLWVALWKEPLREQPPCDHAETIPESPAEDSLLLLRVGDERADEDRRPVDEEESPDCEIVIGDIQIGRAHV